MRRGFAAAALCLALAAPAAAQRDASFEDLLDRLERVERDLAAVQRRLAPTAGAAAALPPAGEAAPAVGESRLAELEQVLRLLTDRLERAEFELRGLKNSLERARRDIGDRLAALESGDQAPPGSPDPAPVADAGPEAPVESAAAAPAAGVLGAIPADAGAPPPEDAPEAAYDRAWELLRRADYAAAEVALQRFIDAWPDNALTGNAYYWLGETHYARRDFQRAAVAFARGYRGFPEGNKAPDNLLKLGMAFAALGRSEDACATFGKLRDDHPGAPALIRDRLAGERERAGC